MGTIINKVVREGFIKKVTFYQSSDISGGKVSQVKGTAGNEVEPLLYIFKECIAKTPVGVRQGEGGRKQSEFVGQRSNNVCMWEVGSE